MTAGALPRSRPPGVALGLLPDAQPDHELRSAAETAAADPKTPARLRRLVERAPAKKR